MKQRVCVDRVAFWVVLASFLVASWVTPARGEESMLVAYGGHSESVGNMWVGIERGLFKKYGVDVQMLQVRSGPVIMATLASASVHLIWTSPSSVLSAVSGGLKLSCVASTTNNLPRELIVKREIKSLNEVRGKVFGVQSLGGGLWLQTMVVLEKLGVDPDSYHLQVRVIGDIPTVTQALLSGNIDAAVLPYSFGDIAKRAGLRSLSGELVVPLQSNVLCSSKELIGKSPQLVTHLIQGMTEAVVFIHDPSHKEDVKAILTKHLRFSRPEDAEASYRLLSIMNTLDVAPDVGSWKMIQRIVSRVNPKVGQVKLDNVIDGRLVQNLENNGFIAEMRKKSKP